MYPPSRGATNDPPQVSRGTQIVTIFVGSEQVEFAVHKNMLCAASKFFERAVQGPFMESKTQQVRLPEERPEVFAFLVDWLYIGGLDQMYPSIIRSRQQWHKDEYYLKVYRMADRLIIPGLQLLTYHRLRNTFGKIAATLPSRDFLYSLFSEEAPVAIQMHVVEHAAYWLLKSTNKEEWAGLFTSHDRFGTEMALAMIRSQAKGLAFRHPEDVANFSGRYGFNSEELQRESRLADEGLPSGKLKELACASTELPISLAAKPSQTAGPRIPYNIGSTTSATATATLPAPSPTPAQIFSFGTPVLPRTGYFGTPSQI
ncbi:hypothetical protein A1O1_04674 [Capronia coronata CBS 617.96]|uniref:BTB domain-containing protein n=1 Tax=Capronia coronata CBS 617.96 TaxID=1182541 RepID=W9Y5E1_9EURO|nr:uncharacterized protein A1O1_04674 [Capronia coronata CBS 617.96]EXJ87748.1 hypothetical protein A1O1_04674 [Capronia coronata CBS 617.96]